jgi:hypothetical protein
MPVRFYLLLLALFLTRTYNAEAQLIAPTTQDEYTYGAVGYKIQLQAKLDTRQGYELVDAEWCEESERKLELKLMYRTGEKQPCAAILVYTRLRNPPQYYCVPTSNAPPVIWDQFHKSLSATTDNPADQLRFFSSCLARVMMDFASIRK